HPTPLPNPFALPCLQKQSTLAPREYSPPQKNLGPAGGKKGRGVQGQSRRRGREKEGKREKHLGGKPPPILPLPRNPFPPRLGANWGRGRSPRAQDARFTVIFGGEYSIPLQSRPPRHAPQNQHNVRALPRAR